MKYHKLLPLLNRYAYMDRVPTRAFNDLEHTVVVRDVWEYQTNVREWPIETHRFKIHLGSMTTNETRGMDICHEAAHIILGLRNASEQEVWHLAHQIAKEDTWNRGVIAHLERFK